MTRRGSSRPGWGTLGLVALALFALGRREPSPIERQEASALERPKIQTGGADPIAWARSRFDVLRFTLATLAPQLPAEDLRRIALSVLAQWAHETARGRNEFDFNLGGWRATAGEPFFRATDSGQAVRFRAFDDLAGGMRIQLERLRARFPSAVKALIADPESSAWVEELGRGGYYTAKIPAYVSAWAANRTELGNLLAGVA